MRETRRKEACHAKAAVRAAQKVKPKCVEAMLAFIILTEINGGTRMNGGIDRRMSQGKTAGMLIAI